MTFDETSGPLLHILGEEMASEGCGRMGPECNVVTSLIFAKYTFPPGHEPLADAEYASKVVCHGKRDVTPEEAEALKIYGKEALTQICDIEIVSLID